MANKTFYISQEGKQQGPFPLDEVLESIKSGTLFLTDFIFDEQVQDWVCLSEFPPVHDQILKNKPSVKPMPSKEESGESPAQENKSAQARPPIPETENTSNWYVLKGENKFGPFLYHEMIKMLQEKLLFEFDFVWTKGFDGWMRVAELNDFEQNKIVSYLDTHFSEAFFRREFHRVKYTGSVIVHDNKSIWKGKGTTLSAGGCGIVIENSMINPGDVVNLHFHPSQNLQPFNATCEIVSKKYVSEVKRRNTPINYGLKFLNIDEDIKKMIESFTGSFAA